LNQLPFLSFYGTSPLYNLNTTKTFKELKLQAIGNTLQTIINNLTDWGIEHRKKIVSRVVSGKPPE